MRVTNLLSNSRFFVDAGSIAEAVAKILASKYLIAQPPSDAFVQNTNSSDDEVTKLVLKLQEASKPNLNSDKILEIRKAINRLDNLGDIRAIEPLLAIVQNKKCDDNIRQEAVIALGKLGKDNKKIVETLMAIVQEKECHGG